MMNFRNVMAFSAEWLWKNGTSKPSVSQPLTNGAPRLRPFDIFCMTQWVYTFGNGSAEGRAEMKNLLGGKGANLAEMSNLGLPVPPGFTITTEVCTHYYATRNPIPPI
jgi:hypothetical protein